MFGFMKEPRVFQPRPETAAAINYVANHDVKGAAYTALAEDGEMTVTDLAHAVSDQSGVDFYACERFIGRYPPVYVKAGFASVSVEVNKSKHTSYYSAENEGGVLPYIGAFEAWSDRFKRPVLPVLGYGGKSEDSKSAVHSLQIIDGLLQGLNVGEMNVPGYVTRGESQKSTVHNTRLEHLVDLELVVAEDASHEFKILDPSYHGAKPFHRLRPETQIAYQAFGIAKGVSPDATWSIQEFTELAQKFNLIDASKVPVLRRLVGLALSSGANNFRGVVEKRTLRRKYTLAEDFREAAGTLLELVKKIDGGSQRLARQAEDYARATYSEPDDLARVIRRGMAASPVTDAYRDVA